MDGRLGNGMTLWLGAALLAHAALLTLPTARPPAGGSVVSSALDVRLLKVPTGSDPIATPEITGADPNPMPTEADASPIATPDLPTEPDLTPMAPMGSGTYAFKDAADPSPAVRAAEMGSDPISDPISEEKAFGTFPDASTALTGQQVITAAARQTSVATLSLDDPAQNPTGTADERDRLRLLELTDRLHQAIERQKRYPLSARRLGREGTASVAFRLRPDGAIDDLEVAASSGEPALDRAALRAVSGISPFGEARTYLDNSAPFRVDIAFRLH